MMADFRDAIAPYGAILRDTSPDGAEVFMNRQGTGWRVAEISVTNPEVMDMSYHENTPEAFFPISGNCALLLSLDPELRQCDWFPLDHPIAIREKVWHGLACTSGEGRILVVENADVMLEKKKLP